MKPLLIIEGGPWSHSGTITPVVTKVMRVDTLPAPTFNIVINGSEFPKVKLQNLDRATTEYLARQLAAALGGMLVYPPSLEELQFQEEIERG